MDALAHRAGPMAGRGHFSHGLLVAARGELEESGRQRALLRVPRQLRRLLLYLRRTLCRPDSQAV
jgi:hypothetical protein